METINPEKDYYQALGLKPQATTEELKASYVILAMKHHPDTGGSSATSKDEFIKISEAWAILSKPDLKSQYDSLRRVYLARTLGPAASPMDYQSTGSHSEIHPGFQTQRNNYASNVSQQASSNWQDRRDKYKTEKWQNLTLKERKAHRTRPVVSAKGGALGILVPTLIVAGLIYSQV